MKKILFLTFLLPVLLLSACLKQQTAIFLNDTPVSSSNFSELPDNPVFNTGQKIYFALVSKKPVECPVLRLQTIKIENKYGDSIDQIEIPYAVDIERGENKNIIEDYFVLYQDGRYFVRIFSKDNLRKPIAETEFIVRKP